MTLIYPVLAISLAASQSGQIDFFLFIRIGLKEVGDAPVSRKEHTSQLLSNAPASRPGTLGGSKAQRGCYIP